MTEIYNATLYGHYVARYITTTYLHCKKVDIYPVLLVLIQHSYISLWYSAIYGFLASNVVCHLKEQDGIVSLR